MVADAQQDITYQSIAEARSREELVRALQTSLIPADQLLANLGLFIDAKAFSRLLFLDHIYRQIVNVPGEILDFGSRWGQNAAVFTTLRGIYEPFNRHRRLVCFDTFTGFPSVSPNDGTSSLMVQGQLATSANYEVELERILSLHESLNPLGHINKHSILKGDARETIPQYFESNPHSIVALAYFDFDLYEPTVVALKSIQDHLTKGSVLAFDELNDLDSPGETVALREVFGTEAVSLRRIPITSRTSYFIFGS
jgi:hypothetical protein